MLSNHWTLVGLISVAFLASAAVAAAAMRVEGHPGERVEAVRSRLAAWFLPTMRWTFLVFYLFAGFAKLNSAFFDPAVSCAVFFLDESLDSMGLGALGIQDEGAVRWAVIVATAAIELAIPWLLMWRRTRIPAVAIAVVFHAVLSIDKAHQIVDFSSFLTIVYLSFLPAAAFTRLVERARSLAVEAAARVSVRPQVLHAAGVALVFLTGLAAEAHVPGVNSSRTLLWWIWQPVVAVIIVVLVRYARRQPDGPAKPLGRPPAWLVAVPALAFVNGLLPYVEVRSAGSWNMYANLRVVDGESNHFVVRRGLPLTREHRELIEILRSDDPRLEYYATEGLLLPRKQLRSYVAGNPDVAVTYRYSGEVVDSPRAGDDPLLDEPVSLFREKFQVFRSVSANQPEACLALWGHAR